MKKPDYLQTMIFLDSGDPEETRAAVKTLGFLDGQTTNPSLVAKNPTIQAQGTLDEATLWSEYQKIATEVREILPNGAISVEVYADPTVSYEAMLDQGRNLSTWFPGIYVKLPITTTGLKVAKTLVEEGININMTLCFSQEQAAAVHAATKGAAAGQVFISPFLGRLDDKGSNGLDLVKNILTMYRAWNSHVMVLAASIRNIDHVVECVRMRADIMTMPLKVIEEWQASGLEKNPASIPSKISSLKPIQFRDLPEQDWVLYDIHHELTGAGLEKFASDWKKLFQK